MSVRADTPGEPASLVAAIARAVQQAVLATIAVLTMGIGVLAPMASVLAAGVGETSVLTSATSRKVHGAAGTFDLPLALTPANPTTEPRLGPSQTIVFVFDKPVTSGTAFVTEGTATIGAVTFGGNAMIVPLTGATKFCQQALW
jgi:hypothetical protein